CNKSFSNGSTLREHMMSESASGSTLPSLETSNNETVLIGGPDLKREDGAHQIKGERKMIVDEADSTGSGSPLTAVEEAGLILVAMGRGQKILRIGMLLIVVSNSKRKEEYYETDLDSDDDNKEVKYKSVAGFSLK
ncbi:LOW QUALITY PROTEIN: hypothetical protein HID58_096160, partial [Brassica napus]